MVIKVVPKDFNDWVDMLKNIVFLLGVMSVSLGFVSFVGWTMYGEPFAKEWLSENLTPLDERMSAVRTEIDETEQVLTKIRQHLEFLPQPQVVEFDGRGSVDTSITYEAGGVVPVTYQLRRTSTCNTIVVVRFYNHDLSRVDTSLTRRLPATQAAITQRDQLFTVDVALPEHMRPGVYSYVPIVTPDYSDPTCLGYEDVVPPQSDRFTVREKT